MMNGAEKMELNCRNEKEIVKNPEELMQELIEYLDQHPELEEVYAEEKKKNPCRLVF